MSVAEPHQQDADVRCEPASPPQGARRPALTIDGILAAMRHPLMVAFLCLAALIQVYRTATALPGRIHEEDFADYYAAGTIMRQGENPYRSSLGAAGAQFGLHTKTNQQDQIIPETPIFLLILKGLAALPVTRAYWTWIAINFAALMAAFYVLLWRASGLRSVDACLLIALALIYPPLIDLFMTAQSQVLVILGLALSVRWLARGRDGLAGLMLAALTLMRGYPGLLGFYLLFTRRWRALAFMAAGGILGIAVSAAAMGWNEILDFPHGMLSTGVDREFLKLGWNTAPASFIWRICFYLNGWKLGPAGDRFAHILGYGASLAIMAFTLKATLKRGATPDRDWRLFALWTVTSIEVLPVSWLNYNTLLFVPFALIASAGVSDRVSDRTVWAAMLSYFLSVFAFGGLLFLDPRFPIAFVVLVAECKSIAVIVGYLSAYWFATDGT
ncbi:MAG TPA: glycosyltransferase family 87 protein [Candidatus Binataceae bacterium]